MYIEDLLLHFLPFSTQQVRVGTFDENLCQSLATASESGRALTQKQSVLALRLIKKYRTQFKQFVPDIETHLDFPRYKQEFRIIDSTKSVSLDKTTQPNTISVRFPYDVETIELIKKQKSELHTAVFDGDQKFWRLSLDENNIAFVANHLIPREYSVCPDIENFVAQYKDIVLNFENHMPFLTKVDNIYQFKNSKIKDTYTSVEQALVASRKFGIPNHDEQILDEIQDANISEELKKVLYKTERNAFSFDQSEFKRADVVNIAKLFDAPVAIIVPDNARPEVLERWINAFVEAQVSLDQVGVYFRKKNDMDYDIRFNNVIKEFGLNKPVSNDVKWMFISTKYPKSLLKEKLYAKICICEEKYINAHYTIKTIMENAMLNFYYGSGRLLVGDRVVQL